MSSSLNVYDVFVPMYMRGLNNMLHILTKGEEYTKSKNIPEEEVMGWKLAPDMLPLTFQVQTVCNGAKNMIGRVTGAEMPPIDDNEKSFADLKARISSTIDMIKALKREQFEGAETREVMIRDNKFTGLSFLQSFAMPNFYFHISVLYALFRSHGASLGKIDYLKGGQ